MSSGSPISAKIERRGSGPRSYVFIHGTPSDRTVYREIADRAPADAAVVLVDLPDHGEAPDEPTASLPPLEQGVLDAVEAAEGEVTVVGHSLGAWLVAATSDRMPSRVKRCIAVAGFSQLSEEGLAMRRRLVAQLAEEAVSPEQVRDQLAPLLLGSAGDPDLRARMSRLMDLSREHWMRIGRRVMAVNDRPPARIHRDALVVHATGDMGVPPRSGSRSGAAQRGGAGHDRDRFPHAPAHPSAAAGGHRLRVELRTVTPREARRGQRARSRTAAGPEPPKAGAG